MFNQPHQIKGSFQFQGAFTFTSAPRSLIDHHQLTSKPSNSYHPSFKQTDKTVPVYSFSKGQRPSFVPNDNGVPVGMYNPKYLSSKLAIKIPTAKQKEKNFDQSPTAYTTGLSCSNAGKSFGMGLPKDFETGIPAVGQYQITKRIGSPNNTKQVYFTTSNRPGSKSCAPGVGDYNIREQNHIETPNIRLFSRRFSMQNENPGPGSYNIASSLGSKTPSHKKRSTSDKFRKPAEFISPGPHYDIETRIKGGNKFGKQKREVQLVSVDPKNTTDQFYMVHSSLEKNHRYAGFTKSLRPRVQKEGPSPGQYYLERSLGSRLGKMGKDKATSLSLKMDDRVGPSNYNPNFKAVFQQYPRAIIQKSKYQEQSKLINRNVGPGVYEVTFMPKNKQSYSFGKAKEMKTKRTPGPGDYNIGGTIGKLPKYHNLKMNCSINVGNKAQNNSQTSKQDCYN